MKPLTVSKKKITKYTYLKWHNANDMNEINSIINIQNWKSKWVI